MWIQVRSMDGQKRVRLDNLSKLTMIEHLRERLVDEFGVEPDRQRLFYRGKQLEDGNSLFDYDVGLNDIIQIMVRTILPPAETNGTCNGTSHSEDESSKDRSNDIDMVSEKKTEVEDEIEGLYKVGEKIDAIDLRMGAWFEGQVVRLTTESPTSSDDSSSDPQIYYFVQFDDYDDEPKKLLEADIRPRARYRMQWDQLAVGQVVMVNYNPDHPKQRGYWYDGLVTRKVNEGRKLYCKLILSNKQQLDDQTASEECQIKFVEEVFRIESKQSGDQCNGDVEARLKKPDCDYCKDKASRKCKHCGCYACGGKDSPDQQILCDECDMAYHMWCLDPPLENIPESDEWYCPDCKTDTSEVIAAGEKMRLTKKKASMMSKKNETTRDWGKGMACVGRTKVCTIVPSNHFGPIPGVPVGTIWKFRVQASEAGVHRPHVAGIHGRENEGAYSIVLSGGYEDDKDDGNEFTYSGSGGRDLSGNRRTAKQSMDQKLTAMNRAMAKNCDAPVNAVNGAVAANWKNGKPIRVIRNHKGRKFSKYCPVEGNRYDGIYKVVKYWPQRNKDGLLVWKYLMRRDDTSPSPWSSEGKKLAKKLGLTIQYPEGYLESHEQNSQSSKENEDKSNRKRKGSPLSSPSKSKQPRYELSRQQRTLINADIVNQKQWNEVLDYARSSSSVGLLAQIEDSFRCIVCQELVYQPISTPCCHNICKFCLTRSFKAEVYSCPNCRNQLGKKYKMEVNLPLQDALLNLFPGYDGGR